MFSDGGNNSGLRVYAALTSSHTTFGACRIKLKRKQVYCMFAQHQRLIVHDQCLQRVKIDGISLNNCNMDNGWLTMTVH